MAAFGPREILLIRHAEKTGKPGDSGLSPLGRARAEALADELPIGFGAPDIIIACKTVPKSSRPVDTVAPLAERLGLPIEDRWNTQDFEALARALRTDPAYRGRRVLVCWRHDTLADLAHWLGAREAPADWGQDLYDCVWVLQPTSHGVQWTASPQGVPPDRLAETARG